MTYLRRSRRDRGEDAGVIESLKLVLAGTGSGLAPAVFARMYLTHFDRDCAAMNAAYQSYFAPGRLPA